MRTTETHLRTILAASFMVVAAMLAVAAVLPSLTGGGGAGFTPRQAEASASLPDLLITAMRIELQDASSCLMPGGAQLGVRIEFENAGKAAAPAFAIEVNGAQQTVTGGLAASGTGERWFLGYNSGGNQAGTVDVNSQVAESDEANNTFSGFVPLPTPPASCTATPTPTVPSVGGLSELARGSNGGDAGTPLLVALTALAAAVFVAGAVVRLRRHT